jgi:hypothetical protein
VLFGGLYQQSEAMCDLRRDLSTSGKVYFVEKGTDKEIGLDEALQQSYAPYQSRPLSESDDLPTTKSQFDSYCSWFLSSTNTSVNFNHHGHWNSVWKSAVELRFCCLNSDMFAGWLRRMDIFITLLSDGPDYLKDKIADKCFEMWKKNLKHIATDEVGVSYVDIKMAKDGLAKLYKIAYPSDELEFEF